MSYRSRLATSAVALATFIVVFAVALPAFAGSTMVVPGSVHTISGTVRDGAGHPIGGATVMDWVWNESTASWDLGSGATCATDGTYLIQGARAGSHRLAFCQIEGAISTFGIVFDYVPQFYNGHDVTSAEFLADMFSSVLPNNIDNVNVPTSAAGPAGIDATLTLEAASISGRVHDADGNPVSSASVTLYNYDSTENDGWAELFSVPVDADGTYAFRGLYGGVYRVGFMADGWMTQYYPSTAHFSKALNIECGPILHPGVDATLTAASTSATGTVLDAVTGSPIAGALISADYTEAPAAFDVSSASATSAADGSFELKGLSEDMTYTVTVQDPAGRHSTVTRPMAYAGTVLGGQRYAMPPVPVIEEFGLGASRTQVARELIRSQLPSGYADVTDVVLAPQGNGDVANTLAAPGLCWAYQVTKRGSVNLGRNAPLIQVPRTGGTPDIDALIGWIALENGTPAHSIRLHLVGVPASIPQAQIDLIRADLRGFGVSASVDRLVTNRHADRFDVAIAVARRIKSRANVSRTDALAPPKIALVGNGSGKGPLLEPLSFSALSAATGAPVLPVGRTSVPKRIKAELASLHIGGANTYIAGDASSVSEGVRSALHVPKANRLSNSAKSSAAAGVSASVMRKAVAKRWLTVASPMALASDSGGLLLGGAAAGDGRGGVLYDDGGDVTNPIFDWLDAHAEQMTELWLVGTEARASDTYHEYLGTPYEDGSSDGSGATASGSALREQLRAALRPAFRAL